jgi:hypothetical protein
MDSPKIEENIKPFERTFEQQFSMKQITLDKKIVSFKKLK